MEVSTSFKNAVNKSEVGKVRIMLKDSLYIDPSFGKFNAMFALAKNMPQLFDEHDDRGENFKPQSEWTEDYGDLLKTQLIANFSQERLEHLKKVVQYIYPESTKPQTPQYQQPQAEHYQTPQYQQPQAEHYQTSQYQQSQAEHYQTPQYQQPQAEHYQTPQYQQSQAERYQAPQHQQSQAPTTSLVSSSFKNAVNNSDINKVRIMLKDSLYTDPSFGKFNAMFELAKNLQGLFEEHDNRGENFKPQSEWTEDYGDLLKTQIIANFSQERLEHLKKVVQYIYPEEAKPKPLPVSQPQPQTPPQNYHNHNQQPQHYPNQQQHNRRREEPPRQDGLLTVLARSVDKKLQEVFGGQK